MKLVLIGSMSSHVAYCYWSSSVLVRREMSVVRCPSTLSWTFKKKNTNTIATIYSFKHLWKMTNLNCKIHYLKTQEALRAGPNMQYSPNLKNRIFYTHTCENKLNAWLCCPWSPIHKIVNLMAPRSGFHALWKGQYDHILVVVKMCLIVEIFSRGR